MIAAVSREAPRRLSLAAFAQVGGVDAHREESNDELHRQTRLETVLVALGTRARSLDVEELNVELFV